MSLGDREQATEKELVELRAANARLLLQQDADRESYRVQTSMIRVEDHSKMVVAYDKLKADRERLAGEVEQYRRQWKAAEQANKDNRDHMKQMFDGVMHDNDRLTQTNASLVECLREWHDMTRKYLDSPGESFEETAADFQRDTGILAPGKDQPMAMNGSPTDDERRKAWREWNERKTSERMGRTRAALAVGGGDAV